MKKPKKPFLRRVAPFVATLALLAWPADAGDCLTGNDCSNACPLAKHANARLATGAEAVTVSKILQKDFARAVLANLDAF